MTESLGTLDERLAKTLSALHRARWIALVVLAVVVIASLAGLGVVVDGQQRTIATQQQRLTASCQFYQLIATLPVPTAPAPSREGTELVTDSRHTYVRQGCGQLPPPSKTLQHWAAVYHLPLQ